MDTTRIYQGFKLCAGHAVPFGATAIRGGVNFSVFSSEATSCQLALFHKGEPEPFARIPFFDDFRLGRVFTMIVEDLDCEEVEYCYVMDGEFNEREGLRFDPTKYLLDPYAKCVTGRDVWGAQAEPGEGLPPYRCKILQNTFDWQGDRPLETPKRELVIYELHVRGFTKHASSGVEHPGTFDGLREKIPYLKELGVNCVELMPIFEFDEFENSRTTKDGGKLMNYWGYSTVAFFAPKAGFAVGGSHSMQAAELKTLIRDLHHSDIEVIFDVVFNHTAEGNEKGPYLSFRGIDNRVYYMLTPNGEYYNFSGCGNTLNCNHPMVRNMILDCLRYWAAEYHVDGFRFDLASILGRDQNGAPMANPPLLELLAEDAVLAKCKLIAEAWDAGGLYQVGTFPSWGRWAEWNGKYRDDMRRFLKGDLGLTWSVAQFMSGSPHIYNPEVRGTSASVNFITCHDGFTLMDLYSYNEKNNAANGEDNRDGSNDNASWDCRVAGYDDGQVQELRLRMVKNALAVLLLSHGVPMLLSGDEFGNSQGGNNNAYCQDNEISWLDWGDLEKNHDLFEFAKGLIALRKKCECLRSPDSQGTPHTKDGFPLVSYHGVQPWNADFSGGSRMLGVMFSGDDEHIYVGLNMYWEAQTFELPSLPQDRVWRAHGSTDGKLEKSAQVGGKVEIGPRTIVILRSTEG